MDSYLCLMHLTTGIVVEALFNAFATAAFFKFMIFSIFEMRYLLIIWKARRPQVKLLRLQRTELRAQAELCHRQSCDKALS